MVSSYLMWLEIYLNWLIIWEDFPTDTLEHCPLAVDKPSETTNVRKQSAVVDAQDAKESSSVDYSTKHDKHSVIVENG